MYVSHTIGDVSGGHVVGGGSGFVVCLITISSRHAPGWMRTGNEPSAGAMVYSSRLNTSLLETSMWTTMNEWLLLRVEIRGLTTRRKQLRVK